MQHLVVSKSPKLISDLSTWPIESEFNYLNLFKNGTKSWNNKYKTFFDSYLNYLIQRTKSKKEYTTNFVLHDVFLSTLGTFYPSPPQIQPHLSLIAEEFLYNLVTASATGTEIGAKMNMNDFECFATEGAAAGILYVFNTLKENYLLKPKDHIAIITPIFSPYLELPLLSDYNLNIIELKGNPDKNYSLDKSEMDKLKDKRIKALFMVNPANPSAYSLSKDNIDYIGNIVNTVRKDLMILSDNVYAPFTNQYNSLILTCPYNTIEIFSLSKYFGTTGWRLGLCMISKKNKFNLLLSQLSKKDKQLLDIRYKIISLKPSSLTFMERLISDSRQVAEGHVGGLSTPQQVLMGLFLFYDIMDKKGSGKYSSDIKHILKNRMNLLYKPLNTNPIIVQTSTNYYTLLDIPTITENLFGSQAKDNLINKFEYLEFLFHLASKYSTVLLPGSGFGATEWRIRVSLANLENKDYTTIGNNIKDCIRDMSLSKNKTIKQ